MKNYIAITLANATFLFLPTFSLAGGPVTLDNWLNHKEVVKVRKIYNQINRDIKDNELQLSNKKFDYKSNLPGCVRSYQIKSRGIATDDLGRIRRFVENQRISHGESMRTELYYDLKGVLRFVFVNYEYPRQERVYLDTKGEILISLITEGKKTTDLGVKAGDYQVKLDKQVLARDRYHEKTSCPLQKEIKAQQHLDSGKEYRCKEHGYYLTLEQRGFDHVNHRLLLTGKVLIKELDKAMWFIEDVKCTSSGFSITASHIQYNEPTKRKFRIEILSKDKYKVQ